MTTELNNTRHALRHVISDGLPPNGTAPEDCGAFAPLVGSIYDAYKMGGTPGVRKAWAALTKQQPNYADLLSRDDTPASARPTASAEWGGILPFHSAELPAFPLDIFPDWLRDFCEAVMEATQTPPDLAGMLALAILSTACGQRIMVRAWNGWEEPINVYTVVSLGPGNRKSVVFRAMMAPVIKFEQDLADKAESEIFQAEAKRDVLKARIEAAKRKTASTQGEHAIKMAFAEIDELGDELKNLEVPVRPKLIVDDVTPETIATILAEQGGRLAILSPEGDIFGIMAGRYTSGPPNLGVYLKAHAGDAIRVDRRSRSEYVKRPALTMGITTQPEVMRSFGSNNAFRGQGLLARFFYALPRSTVGTRSSAAPPIPDQVRATYFRSVMTLLENLHSVHSVHSVQDSDSVHSGRDPDHYDSTLILYIEISTAARNRLTGFMDWLEPQLGAYGALEHIADWAAKLAGAVLRVAGLLHMAETLGQNGQNCQNVISDAMIARAIRLAQYLLPHAQAAYSEIGADQSVEAAKIILRWIEKTAAKTFTRRECYRGVRGPLFKSADDCDAPLRLLTDHNYLRELPSPERDGAGRKPSQAYDVNPIVFDGSHNAHNAQNDGASYESIAPVDYVQPTYRGIEGYD